MALRKNGNQPPTLDQLQAQRQDLAGRLAAVGGQLQRLDPVNDWELASRALGEQQALTMALSALAERIAAQEVAERDQVRQERDAAQQERAAAARARMDETARAYLDALAGLPVANLAAAQHELAAVGGWPSPAAMLAIYAARDIDGAFQQLRSVAPTWLGLPAEDKHARALAEAQDALKRAEQRLANLRKAQNAQRYDADGPTVRLDRVEDATVEVDICRRRLAELQEVQP